MSSRRTNSQRAGVLAVALLAGSSVRLDEIYYRTPLGQWRCVDWIIGVLLGISAALAVLGAQRILESRTQVRELLRRTSGIADAAWVVSRGGHMGAVLDRIAEEACNVTGAERSTLCVLDRADPRLAVVFAGYRTEQLINTRFAIDEGMIKDVFLSREPVTCDNCDEFGLESKTGIDRPGAAAPIRWGGEVRGALAVVATREGKPFGETEIELLTRLADLGSVALEQTEMAERVEIAHASGVEALTAAIDLHDGYTWEHSQNVMRLADHVADRLGFDEAARAEIVLAAKLHDIGKIGVPDVILLKEGTLDPDEWEIMKSSPVWGAETIDRFPGLRNVAAIVRSVHEHWNGEGYPDGLAGEQIPLASRVVLACDAYDALTRDRPWRRALEPWAAVKQLRRGAGHQFDADVVEALTCVLREARLTTHFSLSPFKRTRDRVTIASASAPSSAPVS